LDLEERLAQPDVPEDVREGALEACRELSWVRHVLETSLVGSGIRFWMVDVPRGVFRVEASGLGGVPGEAMELTEEQVYEVIHPDDRAAARAGELAMKNGETDHFAVEQRLLWEGEWRWVVSRSTVLRHGEDGKPLLLAGAAVDVTELKETEAALERANDQLKEFAYVVSHDLKGPLKTIAMTLQQLRARVDSDGESLGLVQRAQGGVGRATQMIDDLLEYSLLGRQAMRLAPVDLDQVLDGVLDDLAADIVAAGASIDRAELPTVTADESQMSQLLRNLVANAVKFRGSDPLRLRITADEDEVEHTVSIADNGVGIDEWKLESIFAPFQRGQEGDDKPGTGIGLAICDRIVERHGGRIWAESEAGAGSVLRFTIPKAPWPAGARPT
jgi:signal transduction histidine kinase